MAGRPTAALLRIREEIIADPANRDAIAAGLRPIYTAHPATRIVLIGQAPGTRAQRDPLERPERRDAAAMARDHRRPVLDPTLFAILPMGFSCPGKGAHGDLPPRPDVAPRWYPRLLAELPHVQLTVVIGRHAQKHYLPESAGANLTDTVRAFRDHFPDRMPLIHPSPLNFRWQNRNPWFAEEAIPAPCARVHAVLRSDVDPAGREAGV